MCLAFLRYDPSSSWPVLLASVRDEDLSRPAAGPGPWWPDACPGAVGGRDLRSGGTWLAVDAAAGTLAAVFTPGEPTPAGTARRSRGELPLLALGELTLGTVDPTAYEPFTLLRADARRSEVTWWASDRVVLTRTAVSPGLHVGNIAGLDATDTSPRQARWVEPFADAAPDPFESHAVLPERWRGWIGLFDGALELERTDALLGRHDTAAGSYGTRSAALVALPAGPSEHAVFDWNETPWDSATWERALPPVR